MLHHSPAQWIYAFGLAFLICGAAAAIYRAIWRARHKPYHPVITVVAALYLTLGIPVTALGYFLM